MRRMKRKRKIDAEWETDLNCKGYLLRSDFPIALNAREHWAKKSDRATKHRSLGKSLGHWLKYGSAMLPVRIIITRYTVRAVDSDNLPSAYKALRDGIADAYGVNDGDTKQIQFVYRQEQTGKMNRQGTHVMAEPLPHCDACQSNRGGTHHLGTIEHGV